MCGIFGYAGKAKKEHYATLHSLVRSLATYSETRGTHSTGFSCRFGNNKIVSDKLTYRGGVFCNLSKPFRDLAKEMPTSFIGHTRYGTGSSPKINNNNHPFYGRHYNMVHNGIVPSHMDIAKKHGLEDSLVSETDSEVILRLFEKTIDSGNTAVSSCEFVLNNIWGNMSVALMPHLAPEIYLFRNENPLWVFTIPHGFFGRPFLMFCSTFAIFEDAWKAVFKKNLKDSGVGSTFLDANKVYTISSSYRMVNSEPENFVVYSIKVQKPFQKYYQYTNWDDDSEGYFVYKKNYSSSVKEFYGELNPKT